MKLANAALEKIVGIESGSEMKDRPKLILASGSPRRLSLLQQIGINPDRLFPTEIDETPRKVELPRALAQRLAKQKAEAAYSKLRLEEDFVDSLILAADTVVAVGRRCLPKAENRDIAESCLRLLSGRNHRVYSGVCLVSSAGKYRLRLIETRVKFSRLSKETLNGYLASGQWRGKAGGYAIQGIAGSFAVKLVGSYTNVVGLPLYETVNLLIGHGYPVAQNWLTGDALELN